MSRIWRGQQGIARTLWVWNVIFPAIAMVIIYLILTLVIAVLEWVGQSPINFFTEDLHPVLLASFYLCVAALAVCVGFGLVSLHRAASLAPKWGFTAKVIVVLLGLFWTVYFAQAFVSVTS